MAKMTAEVLVIESEGITGRFDVPGAAISRRAGLDKITELRDLARAAAHAPTAIALLD